MVCGDKRMKCSGAHIVDRMNVFLPNSDLVKLNSTVIYFASLL